MVCARRAWRLCSTGTLACAGFAIELESAPYLWPTKPHSQEWLCYTMPGRFLPKPVACSNAKAICSTEKSSLLRPTICTPTGSPSEVNPPGTEAAGLPVAEIYQQDFIQSM